ncbi:hypothetical protein ES708_21108 [subsurface metagenome]
MGFGRGKGFSPVIPDVEPPEPVHGTNDCQPTQDNVGHPCQEWNAASQIFTPDHSYTATGLSLMLSQYETTRKGPLIVKIEKMAANCWEAEVMWSKALYSTDLPVIDVNSILFLPLPDLAFEDMRAYARFLGVTLASSATILHAFLEVKAYGGIGPGSFLKIKGIKEANTATFSTKADADGRAVTTAEVAWLPLAQADNTWIMRFNDGQELKDIIQEIIDQGTWASGNALAIKIYNTAQVRTHQVDAWDQAGNLTPPRLHIEYRE